MRTPKPIPADFAARAAELNVTQAMATWKATHPQVMRWESEAGVKCRRDRPGRSSPASS